MIESANEKLKM